MKRVLFILSLIPALVFCGCQGVKLVNKSETAELWEGFESDPLWFALADSWGDGDRSIEVRQSAEWASEGEKSLECTFTLDGEKPATFMYEDGNGWDWAEYKAVGLDVKNPTGETLAIITAITTGDYWVWQESQPLELPPGVTKNIRFDFYDNTLKSGATNWEYSTSLKEAESVKRLAFKIFGPQLDARVFLDNVRLVKGRLSTEM